MRDAAHAFRKRTSCADDHQVIEMLRELNQDIWETLARCFLFRLLNLWTEDQDMLWARQLVTMVKKMNGKLTMRGFPPDCHAADDVQVVLKNATTVGGARLSHTRNGPQYGHVPGRQAREVVFILRHMVEQGIPIFEMDCDVARQAFDHVSHHLITYAMEA